MKKFSVKKRKIGVACRIYLCNKYIVLSSNKKVYMKKEKIMSTVREDICRREKQYFSPYATFSDNSKGREREEPACDFRTPFQRDRDRIIYSNSF